MRISVAVLAAALSGCATYINDTAPSKAKNEVYAVGTKQGFFAFNATVWRCSTNGPGVQDCVLVHVEEQP